MKLCFLDGIPLDLELATTFCSASNIIYMIVQFMLNIEEIQSICLDLSNAQEFPLPPDFQKTRNNINQTSKIYRLYMFFTCVIYGVIQMFTGNPCEELKEAADLKLFCGVFVPTVLPFNMDFFPALQLLFLFELLSSMHIYLGGAYIILMPYEIVLYIKNKMNHLCLILETIPRENDENVQKETMKLCVRYHQHIIT